MSMPGGMTLIGGDILVVVEAILLVDFMPGAGNHQIRPGQDLLFRIDATIDFEIS
jgi:hypothetical protein